MLHLPSKKLFCVCVMILVSDNSVPLHIQSKRSLYTLGYTCSLDLLPVGVEVCIAT